MGFCLVDDTFQNEKKKSRISFYLECMCVMCTTYAQCESRMYGNMCVMALHICWLSAYDVRILSKVIKICPSSENNIENDL